MSQEWKAEDNLRIGIYVRVSRDDQGENFETIETQRDLLLHFAEEKFKDRVSAVYMDDNVSGSGFERDGIRRLQADVRNGELDLLLLKDLSRLGRNNAQTLLFLDFLEEYGVRVITSDGRYDSTIDNDTVGIETWFNERYLRDVSRKIRSVMRFKIERGEYIGTAPFGYVKSQTERNRLCIDEHKADIIREIFEQYIEGQSCAQIAECMNERGYEPPSQRADVKWRSQTIGRILSNRVYIGDTVQGISEKLNFKSKKTRRLPEGNWVITRDTHSAIISRELFEQVAKMRGSHSKSDSDSEGRSKAGHKGRSIHPFRGLLFCGGCGAPMIARKRKNRQMAYICRTYAGLGREGCTSHHTPENELSDAVSEIFKSLFNNQAAMQKAREALVNSPEKSAKTLADLKSIENELKEKIRQQDVLYKDRLENNISEELFLRTDKIIESRIIQLKRSLEKSTAPEAGLAAGEQIEQLKRNIAHLCRDKQMLKILIRRIIVFDSSDTMNSQESGNSCSIPDEGLILAEVNYSDAKK